MQQRIHLQKLNKYVHKKTPKVPRGKPSKKTHDLQNLLKDALRLRLSKKRKKRVVEDELEAMVATCQEFMKSFIILGYSLDGNAVDPIIVAANQQDADALGNYLSKFINSQDSDQD